MLPVGTKICVRCGIKVPSGRPLTTVRGIDEDAVYIRTEQVIRPISWLFGTGIYPVSAEGAGKFRPYATFLIAAVTVVISLYAIVDTWGEPGFGRFGEYMLWGGQPVETTPSRRAEEWPRTSDNPDDEQMRQALEQMVAALEEPRGAGEYHPYQLVTHAFLHGGLVHLVGNMLFLIVVGTQINRLVGNIPMIVLYLLLAVAGGLSWRYRMEGQPLMPMIGASGAVMGLCGMFVALQPICRIYMVAWIRWGLIGGFQLLHKIFALPGLVVVGFYIGLDVLWMGLGVDTGVAHSAHLGGFGAGVTLAVFLLVTRLIHSPGNILSLVLGKWSWPIVGRPREGYGLLVKWLPI